MDYPYIAVLKDPAGNARTVCFTTGEFLDDAINHFVNTGYSLLMICEPTSIRIPKSVVEEAEIF